MTRRQQAAAAGTAHVVDPGTPAAVAYRVIRSARRRKTIQIDIEHGEVLVRAPLRASEHEIRDLVRERAGWIAQQQAAYAPLRLEDGACLPVLGAPHTLRVQPTAARHASVERGLMELRIGVPGATPADGRDGAVRDALVRWLRSYADEVLPVLVRRRATDLDVAAARVLVRDQRRRWGSCAPDGTIRLNWRLVMLEEALIDYVVVHELAHLHQRNHGAAFWDVVAAVLPDHRERRRELREAGRRLAL